MFTSLTASRGPLRLGSERAVSELGDLGGPAGPAVPAAPPTILGWLSATPQAAHVEQPTLSPMTPEPTARRDAGLRRVSRITRIAIAGALAATAGFAALAARAFPGTATPQATSPITGSAASPSTTLPTTTPAVQGGSMSSSSSNSQLQAPSTTVQPSRRSGRVTSGGS